MNARAIKRAENYGIIFLDEIDKLAGNKSGESSQTTTTHTIKGEGVQKELLGLIEVCLFMAPIGK